MNDKITKKEYIKPTKAEVKDWKENLYNSLMFLATERPYFRPKKRDSLQTLLDSFFYWADQYNDGYFPESKDAATDRYCAWLVQEHIRNHDWDEFIRLYDSSVAREIEAGLISFECPIYVDTLTLLVSGPVNILDEVNRQISQGDPCCDNIKDEMLDNVVSNIYEGSKRIDTALLEERFDETTVDELMNYITYDEDKIEFDYSEASACDDRRLGVYNILCQFHSTEYINDKYFGYEREE